jgi:oxygen-independent coproporphyrinogen-3 oxidase
MSLTPAPARSLYLHFPFCETKCHYCDFYSLGRDKTKAGDADRFEQALIREIELRAREGALAPSSRVETIFFGGGTPSMTPPDSMARITRSLREGTSIAADCEWTMEANPSSIDRDRFREYRALGINRVSMGVQSLKNEQLAKLGRVHNEGEALRALEQVFAAGFENVSTDLLCGVPGQTVGDLRDHIERLTAFPIMHLSIYLLTLPPHHAMYRELPGEEEQLAHLLLIDSEMRSRGFEHYEISNFARPGKRARHNLVYWTGGSYLAFGPSAHSYSSGDRARFKNVSSLHKYASLLLEENRLPVEWTETLSEEQKELEKWLLAIRLADGFPREWLAKEAQKQKAAGCIREGLLEVHPDAPERLRATPRGFALSDALVRELS